MNIAEVSKLTSMKPNACVIMSGSGSFLPSPALTAAPVNIAKSTFAG